MQSSHTDLSRSEPPVTAQSSPPAHRTFYFDDNGRPTQNVRPTSRPRTRSLLRPEHKFNPELRRQLVANYEKSVNQVDQLFTSLRELKASDHDELVGMAEQSLVQIVQDKDLMVSLGIAPGNDRYPARHSVQTAMLAMSTAAIQGLKKDALIGLGVGCMAHDAGMLHINRELFESKERLDAVAFLEVTRHPTITFDLMAKIDHLAGPSRLVAYQMHERCDGSGYPRRRNIRQIHPLSRIASVADVFIALISPRPHRPGMMPYYAMEHLLREAKRGIFDTEAVRALLRTVSLFPLGSFVELSDGRVGQVLRANGELYTRPIVSVWNKSCLAMPPDIINLAEMNELCIVRPLPELQAATEAVIADTWE